MGKDRKDDFLNRSKELIYLNANKIDEKKNMDLIGILYSEIKSLPEECVIYLD